MSQPDVMFKSLIDKCAVPSVANEFLKGFSGAAGYRTRYASEYQAKCVTAAGPKPSTSVFTPEVMAQQAQLQQQLQTTGQLNPVPAPQVPAAQQPAAQPAASTPSGGAGAAIQCNRVTNSEWFCDFKFPSSQRLSGDTDTTETSLQACQTRCFDNKSCGGWAIRQKDGVCRLYTTSGDWPYKTQMAAASGWIGGPRWDTRQGSLSGTNGGSSSTTDDTTTTNTNTTNNTTTTDTRSFLTKVWQDHKALVIIGVLMCLFVVFGSMSMVLIAVI